MATMVAQISAYLNSYPRKRQNARVPTGSVSATRANHVYGYTLFQLLTLIQGPPHGSYLQQSIC